MSSQNENGLMTLTIDFEELGFGSLCKLLVGIRSLFAKAIINYLDSSYWHEEVIRKNKIDIEKYREKCRYITQQFEESYFELYRKRMPIPLDEIKRDEHISPPLPDSSLTRLFDNEVFEEWVRNYLDDDDIIITRVSYGSIELSLALAGILSFLQYDYNYSILKDCTQLVFEKIKEIVRGHSPTNSINGLEPIIKNMSRDKRIKKLEIRIEGDSLNFKSVWYKDK